MLVEYSDQIQLYKARRCCPVVIVRLYCLMDANPQFCLSSPCRLRIVYVYFFLSLPIQQQRRSS